MIRERNKQNEKSELKDTQLIYAYVDGLISKRLELVDTISDRDLGIGSLEEAKLSAEDNFTLKAYKVWRKDRVEGDDFEWS